MAQTLSSTDIDNLIAAMRKYPYLCNFGTVSLGPLAGPPAVAPDTQNTDVTLYETEGSTEASFLTKNDLTITINTRNVDTAIDLQDFAKGENIFASTRKKTVTLVPITGSTTAKTLTFPNAYLQPGLNYSPGENGQPSSVTLTITCKADATTGKPFTYGT